MLVHEPCNYVSNLAYYHSATRVCDYPDWSLPVEYRRELKRGFMVLTMGSAMWHGSHTYLGYQFDNTMIAMISYIGYQGMISQVGSDNNILKYLQHTPRNHTALEVSEDLTQMLATQPFEKWGEFLGTMDIILDYFVIFAAILVMVLTMTLPQSIATYLLE